MCGWIRPKKGGNARRIEETYWLTTRYYFY